MALFQAIRLPLQHPYKSSADFSTKLLSAGAQHSRSQKQGFCLTNVISVTIIVINLALSIITEKINYTIKVAKIEEKIWRIRKQRKISKWRK